MKDYTDLYIKLNLSSSSLTKKQKKKLDKIIKKEKKDNVDHFSHSGWRLDLDFIVNDIISEFLGFAVKDYIISGLIKDTNLAVFIGSEGISLVNPDSPAMYYDKVTDSIVENVKVNFGNVGRYEHLGVL